MFTTFYRDWIGYRGRGWEKGRKGDLAGWVGFTKVYLDRLWRSRLCDKKGIGKRKKRRKGEDGEDWDVSIMDSGIEREQTRGRWSLEM